MRPADTSSHISLYPNMRPADLRSYIPLMNAQMGSPMAARREGCYNQHNPLMSPPFARKRLQNNSDSNLNFTWSTGSSSSGDNFSTPSSANNFSTPSSANNVRPRNVYGSFNSLSLGESFGKFSSSSATRSPSPMFAGTPVKMEEDVLVMDGILVGSAQDARSKLGRDSSGSSGRSYKTEVCRSWAETGNCRYGSNCQFSNTYEDSTPTRYSIKRLDTEIWLPESPFRSPHTSSLSGPDSSPTMSRGAVAYGRSPHFPGSGPATIAEDSSSQDSSSKATSSRQAVSPAAIYPDWSPLDDGIDVMQPPGSVNKPLQSREEVSAYIDDFLDALHVKKRLPVYTSICPDDNLSSHDHSVNRSPSFPK